MGVARRVILGRLDRARRVGGAGQWLTACRRLVERGDQGAVVTRRFGACGAQAAQDGAHVVEGRQHQGHDIGAGAERAVPQAAQDVLGGVGQPLQAWQAEEAAGSLDGVHGAKDLRQRRRVVRCALQPQQRRVQLGQALVRFRQEIRQQLVHCAFGSRMDARPILAWTGEEIVKLWGRGDGRGWDGSDQQ
jgi:hypothetical protein